MADEWTRGAYRERPPLEWVAYEPVKPGVDEWIPVPGGAGSWDRVTELARIHAATTGGRVVIVALRIDGKRPSHVTEQVLLRSSVPWF